MGGWTRRRDRRAGERARNNPPSPIPSLKWNPFLRWLPGRWKSKRPLLTSVLVPLLTGFFFAITALAFVAAFELLWGDGDLLGLDKKCRMADRSCGLLTSLALALYPLSAAVFWVFIWRLDRVRNSYRKEAWKNPDRLLETQIPSDNIVGRDDLCEVLQKDLARHSADESGTKRQRPVILVGGVGIGKTAVLARLTQLLAERGAVPVPIRLRAAQRSERLDLHELARKKFLDTAPVLSDAEADKIWRRLKANRQIVIVADGLEEALTSATDTRETALRVAIRDVRRHGVALIVSSRPHEALAYLDAALVTLEPLEPHAAYEYITEVAETDDQRNRARGIVRRAAVAEMPLFMHYARELAEVDALDIKLDVRDVGRLGLRVRLLDRWMEVLQAGRIQRSVAVTPERRGKVIAELQSFAVVGLIRDSLEVTFDDIKELAADEADRSPPSANGSTSDAAPPSPNGANRSDRLKQALGATTEGLREVAADADRLGLADAQPEGVRFRHSVMQAYLGSRAITEVLSDGGADENTLRKVSELLDDGLTTPGRELLMALAMSCTVGSEAARTRAIALLLRNVDREGAKAVHTASAVIAAASASTEQTLARITPTPTGAAYARVGDFRDHVVLWLKRGEREDAEREAKRAFGAVDRARRRATAADREEYQKVLALRSAEEAEHRITEVGGVTDRAKEATRGQATLARKQAEADLAAAHAVSDVTRSDLARAWAEVGVAKTILAERLLAEADAEPDPEAKARRRKEAEASLGAARTAAKHAADMRRKAAEHQDPVGLQNLDAGPLVEFFVERAALAQAELVEAQAEVDRREKAASNEAGADDADAHAEETHADGPSDHDFDASASERLDEVIEMALSSPLIRRTGGRDAIPPNADSRAAEAAALADAVHGSANVAEKTVNDAEAESDVDRSRELLIEARRQLNAETDEDPFDPRLWDADTARARITTIRLAARALSSAAAARQRLGAMRAEGAPAATVNRLRKRAIASLGEVSKSLEVRAEASPVLKVDQREAATEVLALAALAEVKAKGAKGRLEQHATAEEGKAPEPVYVDAEAVVHEVVEQAHLAQSDSARAAVEMHRATSRRQVLEPLKRTTRDHDAQADEGVQASKLDAIARLADAVQFSWLWEVCKAEPDYLIRLAAARRLGDGGWVAFGLIEPHMLAIEEAADLDLEGPPSRATAGERLKAAGLGDLSPDRAFELIGLLLPLLYASVGREARRDAVEEREEQGAMASGDGSSAHSPSTAPAEMLQRWVRRVGRGMFITTEMALAQGFRLAANQRTLDSGQRGVLTARVRELLQRTDFWFTRIALIQALTLGLIADTAGKAGAQRDGASDYDAERKIYGCWEDDGHPLVARTIELCAKAFRRRQPENYIWLDEGLATAKLGAGPAAVHAAGTRDECIPESAGWLSLDSPAQQLLGDTVVFLNLADRGGRREELLGNTKASADEPDNQIWPPCMARPEVRYRLHVRRSADERPEPGADCAPECDVGLCPYPGLGEELARGELSEAFCRRQQEITSSGELKRFWREMEERPRA